MSYLKANMGLSDERIRAVGYGKAKPVASNETEEDRKKNRRIDLVLEIGEAVYWETLAVFIANRRIFRPIRVLGVRMAVYQARWVVCTRILTDLFLDFIKKIFYIKVYIFSSTLSIGVDHGQEVWYLRERTVGGEPRKSRPQSEQTPLDAELEKNEGIDRRHGETCLCMYAVSSQRKGDQSAIILWTPL